jgi:hypothetical protein
MKGEAATSPKGHLRHPPDQVQGRQGRRQGARKSNHPESQTGQSDFPELGQHICSRVLVQQVISNPTTTTFRRSGASSPRLSSGVLLSCRATNAWAMGASVDDVPTLSSLGGVVRSMGATTDALSPRMVRTYSRFWPRRLLRRRRPLRKCRPLAGQKGLGSRKLDSLKCQTGPSSFPRSSCSFWSPA